MSDQPPPAPDHGRGYEPPQVERVLTPTDLECEILYAGTPGPSQDEVSA
jgi:hypothetical protein